VAIAAGIERLPRVIRAIADHREVCRAALQLAGRRVRLADQGPDYLRARQVLRKHHGI